MKDLGKAVRKSVFWTFISRGFLICFEFSGSILLARLLEPKEFGIYGIALLFTGLSTRLGNLGFGYALVREKKLRKEHISSVLCVNILIYGTLGLLLYAGASSISTYFKTPEVEPVLIALAITFFIIPFNSVFLAILQRRMEYRTIEGIKVTVSCSRLTMNIVLAAHGWGVWALVYGTLLESFLELCLTGWKARWRPRLHYHHESMKDLYNFGFKIFIKNILFYGSGKITHFIVAKTLGVIALGFYEKAFETVTRLVNQMIKSLNNLLFSTFSRIQDDPEKALKYYKKMSFFLALIIYPIVFGIFATSPIFVQVLYGEKWTPIVVPMQLMCIQSIFYMNLIFIGAILNAFGKVGHEIFHRIINIFLLGIGGVIGCNWGISGVVTVTIFVSLYLALMLINKLKHLLETSLFMLIKPQIPALLCSLLMCGIVFGFQETSVMIIPRFSIVQLISSVVVGVVSYIGSLIIFKRFGIKDVVGEVLVDLRMEKLGKIIGFC